MTFQPHKHEGPPWPGSATYGERMWPAPQRAQRAPDVPILADWGHKDCTICAEQDEELRRAWLDAGYRVRPQPAVEHALAIAYLLAAVCWAIIGTGVWFVWRLF